YALLYLGVQLGIGEAVEDGAADGGAKSIGDRVCQRGISGARCNHKVHVHPTPGTRVTAGERVAEARSFCRAHLAGVFFHDGGVRFHHLRPHFKHPRRHRRIAAGDRSHPHHPGTHHRARTSAHHHPSAFLLAAHHPLPFHHATHHSVSSHFHLMR